MPQQQRERTVRDHAEPNRDWAQAQAGRNLHLERAAHCPPVAEAERLRHLALHHEVQQPERLQDVLVLCSPAVAAATASTSCVDHASGAIWMNSSPILRHVDREHLSWELVDRVDDAILHDVGVFIRARAIFCDVHLSSRGSALRVPGPMPDLATRLAP